jgi:hypothetical protein
MQFSCGVFKSLLIYRIYLRLALSDRFARFAFGVLSFATSPPSSHPAQNAKAEVLQLCKSGRISWADMVLAPSVAGLFKWRQFEPEVILLAVGWYLRFSLAYRDVEELLTERGLHARGSNQPTTVGAWTKLMCALKASGCTCTGPWTPLGQRSTSFSRPNAMQQLPRAFRARALGRATIRVINTDKHAAYPPTIVQLKDEGALEENCQHRPVQYLW